jgi:hypothetical protein
VEFREKAFYPSYTLVDPFFNKISSTLVGVPTQKYSARERTSTRATFITIPVCGSVCVANASNAALALIGTGSAASTDPATHVPTIIKKNARKMKA